MNSRLLDAIARAAPAGVMAISIVLTAHGVHFGAHGDPIGATGPNLHAIAYGDPIGSTGPN